MWMASWPFQSMWFSPERSAMTHRSWSRMAIMERPYQSCGTPSLPV